MTWEKIRDDVAGMLADGKSLNDVIETLEKYKIEMEQKAKEDDYFPINCHVCNGKGWIAGNAYCHTHKCPRCDGSGKIDYKTLTNEDFIKTASAEQLAETIHKMLDGGLCDVCRYDCRERCFVHTKEDEIKVVVEWLKQPHREERQKMKCPVCDGIGEVANYHKIDFDEPTEPLTNNEWFCGLPITEKAEFLAKLVSEAIKEHGKVGATRCESVIWLDEWLKQPHTKE